MQGHLPLQRPPLRPHLHLDLPPSVPHATAPTQQGRCAGPAGGLPAVLCCAAGTQRPAAQPPERQAPTLLPDTKKHSVTRTFLKLLNHGGMNPATVACCEVKAELDLWGRYYIIREALFIF